MAAANTDSPLKKRFAGRLNKVYILPTGFGLVYAASLFLMLLLAYTYQSNLAYALTFFLMSFGFVVMLVTHRTVMTVRLREKNGGPFYAGLIFPAPLMSEEGTDPLVVNHGVFFRPPRGGLLWGDEKGWSSVHRGVFRLPRVEVRSVYPLGLFQAWKFLPTHLHVVVAPAPLDHGLKPDGGGSGGTAELQNSIEPQEIGDLSPARPEDPPSAIDWRSMARGRGWQKKSFVAHGRHQKRFSWSQTESLEDAEKRLQQKSAWIFQAQSQKQSVVVELPDGTKTTSLTEALTALALWGDDS